MPKCRLPSFTSLAAFLAIFLLAQAAPAQNGPASTSYVGYMGHVGCDSITGWAADRYRLNTAIQVRISSDGQTIASMTADSPFPGVASYLGDNGLHGFSLPTPPSLLDGQRHNIHVAFESSTSELTNSPVSLTCPAQLPPLCANVVITTTPPQGSPYVRVNRYCRDSVGRTRYEDERFAKIDDVFAQTTTFVDKQSKAYATTSWNTYPLIDDPYDTAVSDDLAEPGPPLPPRDPKGCPTSNEGWSVTAKPAPNQSGGSSSTQNVNVWACPSLALPMYTQIIDPVLGTVEIDYDLDPDHGPDASLFTIPAGYTQDSLLAMSSSGVTCPPQSLLEPVILVTSSSRPGRTVMTSVTNGSLGCGFSNSKITVGRNLSAVPLTSRNLPIFQLYLSDNMIPDPLNLHSVDFARVTLVTYDGSTSNSLIIRISVP
jgi:hypothetical protein